MTELQKASEEGNLSDVIRILSEGGLTTLNKKDRVSVIDVFALLYSGFTQRDSIARSFISVFL
jgi:hypothetical protein